MKKKISICKKGLAGICAVLLLIVALPVGLVPVADAEDTAPFTYSISTLDGYNAGWNAFYASWDATAYAYRDHILADFDMYGANSNGELWALTRDEIGQTYCSYFGYSYNGFVRCEAGSGVGVGTKTFDRVTSLVPKTAKTYRNFETTFEVDFENLSTYTFGAAVLAFRQQSPGKFISGTDTINKDMAFVSVSPNGVTIEGGANINDAYYDAQEYAYATAVSQTVKVTVKVVGDRCKVVVTSVDGETVYFEKTEQLAYDLPGYIAYGISGPENKLGLGKISLQHLDENGNAVGLTVAAVGENAAADSAFSFSMSSMEGYSTGWNAFYASWDTTAYAYRDHVLASFGMYAQESADSIWGPLTNHQIGNSNCSYFGYSYNGWLRRHTQTDVGSKTFDKVTSLVPKNLVPYQNFETTFSFDFSNEYTFGGVILAFRQQKAGKFIEATDTISKEMAFVSVTRDGVTIEGGANTNDAYYNTQEYAFDTALPASVTAVKVTVKAVGDQCYVKVTSTDGKIPYFEKTESVPYITSGYVAYGVSGKVNTVGFGSISLQHLDDAGNVIGNASTPAEEAWANGMNVAVPTFENGKVYVVSSADPTKTVTLHVVPEDGYELKAGSLVATAANGTAYVPTRVGFRNGGDAVEYTITPAQTTTLAAVFVQPSLEGDPNIGNVGVSVNTALSGVRFVSRFTHVTEGENTYKLLDGEKRLIKDYGMLLSSEPGLNTGNGTDDLKLDTDNKYVAAVSVKDKAVYYDVCEDHIDMSTCIVNIDKVAGYTPEEAFEVEFYARPYVVVEVNGEDVVLYGAYFSSSYSDVSNNS